MVVLNNDKLGLRLDMKVVGGVSQQQRCALIVPEQGMELGLISPQDVFESFPYFISFVQVLTNQLAPVVIYLQ